MSAAVRKIVFVLGLIFATPVIPGTPVDDLGNCLVDALNGKERKELAKWMFFAISAHPEISSYSNVSSNDIEEMDKSIGKLITRLLTSDCPNELRIANQADPLAIRKSFSMVGKVAMQELMSNQNVVKAITGYAQYADQNKINSLLINK